MEIEGKAALVTGAANGIGFEIVKELLKSKAKGIILADINETAGEIALTTLQEEFDTKKVYFIKTDVTNETEFNNAFKKAKDLFGSLDIVVNNAGIVNDNNYNLTININLIGVVRGIILGLNYMGKDKQGKGGIILNIGSTTAFERQEYFPIYSSTKAGILNLTRAFGHNLHYDRTGVKVLALCPGHTETGLLERSNLLNNCKEALEPLIVGLDGQSASTVGRSAVYVMKNGNSGTVWMIDKSKLYKVRFPTWQAISEIEMQDI